MTPEAYRAPAPPTATAGRARAGGFAAAAAPGEAHPAGAAGEGDSQRHRRRVDPERVAGGPAAAVRASWAFDTTAADGRRQAHPISELGVVGDVAASLRRLTGLLHGGNVDPYTMLAEVTSLSATVAGCCQELERRLAADPAGYPPRAARRMVQASGAAEALTTRLTDVIAAIRDRAT